MKKVLSILAIFLLCAIAVPAHAATLFAKPVTSTVTVGNIVTVNVGVATGGKAINNSETTVQFPADMLEVVSVSKNSSIFTLWVEEPRYSNAEGTIFFNGGVPNPGYTGENGQIVSVTFKAKKAGAASISFGDAAVRENNGLGTDILTAKQAGMLQIQAPQVTETPVVPTVVDTLPAKPVVTSSSHPSSEAWYANTKASFSWTVPAGVTTVQTLLGTAPDTVPTITYDSSVTQRTVANLSDGVLYFHIRYKNAAGWGPTAHYKIQIDATAPESFTPAVTRHDSRSVVDLKASDALSGVESYLVQIDDSQPFRVKSDELASGTYELPVQNEGGHTLSVIAYDKAGNKRDSQASFTSPAISAPSLALYPERITKGESVVIRGKSAYAQAKVTVFVQPEGRDVVPYEAVTATDGSFSVSLESVDSSGTITVWSQLSFGEGIKSPVSEKQFLKVDDTGFVRTTSVLTYVLSVIIPVIALLIVLGFLGYLAWHKFFGLRRKVRRDMQKTAQDVHEAMMMLKEELENQLGVLEQAKIDRNLNRQEERIFKELQKNIDAVDKFIEKKLRPYR